MFGNQSATSPKLSFIQRIAQTVSNFGKNRNQPPVTTPQAQPQAPANPNIAPGSTAPGSSPAGGHQWSWNQNALSNPQGIDFSGIHVTPLDQPSTGYKTTYPIAGGPGVKTPYTIPALLPKPGALGQNPSSTAGNFVIPGDNSGSASGGATNPDGSAYSFGSAFGDSTPSSGGGSSTGTNNGAPGAGAAPGAVAPGSYADYVQKEADAIKKYQDYETSLLSAADNIYRSPGMAGFEQGQLETLNRNTQIQGQNLLNAANYYGTLASASKPESLAYGSSLVSPLNGQTVAGGISPDDTQLLGTALADGRITKDMLSRYSIPAILSALRQGGNPVGAKAGAAFFTSPETQRFIANSNTALSTLDQIKQLSSLVPRGSVTMLNNGMLKLKAGVSDQNAAQLVQLSGILADEIGKILGSGQGSDFTIQLGQSLVNPSYSPETFAATIDQLKGRVQNKIGEYYTQGGQQAPNYGGSSSSGGSSGSGGGNGWF